MTSLAYRQPEVPPSAFLAHRTPRALAAHLHAKGTRALPPGARDAPISAAEVAADLGVEEEADGDSPPVRPRRGARAWRPARPHRTAPQPLLSGVHVVY